MTRHFGIPHPQPGKLYRAAGRLDDRFPVGVCVLIWAALLVPVWGGIEALALWMAR